MSKYILHTDGGARGNPGPAGIGVVIEGLGTGKKEYAEYIGEATNNVAEYRAVIVGLKKLKSLVGGGMAGDAQVTVMADSELIVKQMNREYKIKEKDLQGLFVELWNLCLDFGSVEFQHVAREKNAGADMLVNQALDKEASKLPL